MVRHRLLFVGLTLVGCRGSGSDAAACDRPALVELGQALAQTPEHEQVARVMPGLVAACGELLPKPVANYFEKPREEQSREPSPGSDRLDPALESMLIEACPSWAMSGALILADAPADQRATAAYRACSFDRYGVLSEAELGPGSPLLVSWALHQWLLDQGLEGAQAKPITRALMALERKLAAIVVPVAGQTLPVASGLPLGDGFAIYVTRDAIRFNGQSLGSLADGEPAETELDGRLIRRVHDAFADVAEQQQAIHSANGEEWRRPVVIAADASTPYSTILAMIETTAELGFDEFGLAVDAGSEGIAQIPILLSVPKPRGAYVLKGPSSAIPQADPSIAMRLELGVEHTLLGVDGQELDRVEIKSDDFAAIIRYAEAFKRDHPRARRVVVSVEPSVPTQTLAAALAAVRGPECDIDELGCILTELVLTPDRAAEPDDQDEWEGYEDMEYGPRSPRPSLGRVVLDKHTVDGNLDADIVRRIVRAHQNELHACYDKGLARDPKLAGSLTIDFVIGGNGKVRSSVVESSTVSDATIATCVAKAIKRWRFPTSTDGKDVKVSYPFTLRPK